MSAENNHNIKISFVMPTYNEGAQLTQTLTYLRNQMDEQCELIIADGSSSDGTTVIAKKFTDKVLTCDKGRGQQQRQGAYHATGEIIVFLHADTRLPKKVLSLLRSKCTQKKCWGRFNVRITGKSFWLKVIATLMNARSCVSNIATGDQAIFVTRSLYSEINGMPNIPLMEDIEFSRRLKQHTKSICMHECAETSGRRWQKNGIARTVILMWSLRLAYYLGASPVRLAKIYYGK